VQALLVGADLPDLELVDVAAGAGEDDDDLLANCANAAISRYCASSSLSFPAIDFIALICALPPTRLTLMPTLMAGRTPE